MKDSKKKEIIDEIISNYCKMFKLKCELAIIPKFLSDSKTINLDELLVLSKSNDLNDRVKFTKIIKDTICESKNNDKT